MNEFPAWTLLPFPALVLSIAALPLLLPHLWEKHWFQVLVAATCAVPVVAYLCFTGGGHHVSHALLGYAAFITTIGALYITSGGIHVSSDLRATPEVNTGFLLVGATLASVIGTTGASMLLIRPLLRTNRQRRNTYYLVPFFILMVANAGGLLTPLGDPPLLVGYILGVPFFWTLRLWPIWVLYLAVFAGIFFVLDRRAYRAESAAALARDQAEVTPVIVTGRINILLLLLIVPAALLPQGFREGAMVSIALASYFGSPASVHADNAFNFAPILDVAIIFAGLFLCLTPIEFWLAAQAPHLPIQHAWQIFWASGLLSSVLDNAPTYTAFAALARGLGGPGTLVAGMDPIKLAALSAGSVLMGATTYIGNGPNLMVKAIAEREGLRMPSFARYALFAFTVMLPAHLVLTAAFALLER